MKPNVIIVLNRLVIGGQAVDTIPLAYYLQNYFNVLILYGEKEADEIEASFLLEQYPNLQVKKIKQLRRTINPITDLIAFFSIVQQIKKQHRVLLAPPSWLPKKKRHRYLLRYFADLVL